MKSTFKLDEHPRRPRPVLSEPPADYFQKLPTRIMARLPQAEAAEPLAWRWLTLLPASLRTGLATTAVLAGFAGAFWASAPGPRPAIASAASLDAVPQTELVGYLLNSGVRIETTDLAVLTATQPNLSRNFLQPTEEELTEVLDTQPHEEAIYL